MTWSSSRMTETDSETHRPSGAIADTHGGPMIRSTFRHAPRLEALESREVLASGGPTAQAQQMLEMLNQARTNPAQMADRITSNLDTDAMATVKHYNVDLNQVRNAIASAAPKQPL